MMKKKVLFSLTALTMMSLAACNQIGEPASQEGTGTLVIELRGAPSTKAGTDAAGNEETLKDTQIFIFNTDSGESLYRKETVTGADKTLSVTHMKAGTYTVAALSNYPALNASASGGGALNPKTRKELEDVAVNLGMCDPQNCFLLYGVTASPVTVRSDSGTEASSSASAAKADVTLRRFASRVRLVEVENELPEAYGALKVDHVFLENGYGSWTIGAAADPTGPVNWGGRKEGKASSATEGDFIQAQGDAQYPAQTFRDCGTSVARGADKAEKFNYLFYTFPNPAQQNQDNFSGPLAGTGAACVRLVVRATFEGGNGRSFYYPVTILGAGDKPLARNTSYDVRMTIRGEGVSDPNEEPKYGNLNVEIAIAPWDDGGEVINKEF